jgi:hypothetical protein
MTRIRVAFRGPGLIAAAVAAALSPIAALPQTAQTVTLQGANGSSCAYDSITTLPNGAVTVACTQATTPGNPGKIGFSAAAYLPVAKDAPSISVTVMRLEGATDAQDGTVTSTTPSICTPNNGGAVHFNNNDAFNKTVLLTPGNTLGTCALSFALAGTATAQLGNITTTTLEITAPGGQNPVPAGCEALTPTTNYQAHTDFGPSGQGTRFSTAPGIIHSWPLPKRPGVLFQVPAATIVHTADVGTPTEVTLEWSISKCPGDTAYYKTTTAQVTQRQVVYTPCGGTFNVESGGLKFNATGSADNCKVPATEQWYINLRIMPNGSVNCQGGTCKLIYSWSS